MPKAKPTWIYIS